MNGLTDKNIGRGISSRGITESRVGEEDNSIGKQQQGSQETHTHSDKTERKKHARDGTNKQK